MPSQKSERTLAELAKLLDSETSAGLSRLVSVAEAQQVLNAAFGMENTCSPDDAEHMARSLVGMYPAREVNDAKAYASGVTALMSAYPLYAVRHVCNPVTGLPSRLKWLPTLAEIREALDAEKARHGRIARNCFALIKASEKAEEDRRWEKERPNAEARAAQVKALLKCREMTDAP